MAQKYSRQRETILEALNARCDHPTADDIYAVVKQELPRISLGTVYRNLSQLSQEGVVMRIRGCDGPDRFDGYNANHYHFVCHECGNVYDVEMPEYKELEAQAQKAIQMEVESHCLLFYGRCKECRGEGEG